MKEIEISKQPVPKEKNFSSSLTKTAEHLASNPILITKKNVTGKKPVTIAQSCPTFSTVPPPPPRTKPNVPSRDPPPMLLPPSPPVFSPVQIQAAQSQLHEVKSALSRSLSNYSSSCPDPSYLGGLRPPYGNFNQPFGGMSNQMYSEMSSPQQPVLSGKSSSQDDIEERMSELGKSPTIFSLLQGSSVPSSRATSFVNNSNIPTSLLGAQRGNNSVFNPRSSGMQNEFGPDVPEDDLLFSISLDQHDNDVNYLADSTRDYLHL